MNEQLYHESLEFLKRNRFCNISACNHDLTSSVLNDVSGSACCLPATIWASTQPGRVNIFVRHRHVWPPLLSGKSTGEKSTSSAMVVLYFAGCYWLITAIAFCPTVCISNSDSYSRWYCLWLFMFMVYVLALPLQEFSPCLFDECSTSGKW